MTVSESSRVYRCAVCNRKLKDGRWVYSRHTGNRYCWPSEGHNRSKRRKPR